MKIWPVAPALLVPILAFAHGGGLNAEGCHTNRKTGDYHRHRGPSVAPLMPQGQAAQQKQAVWPKQAHQPSTGPTCYTGPRGGT